MPLGPIVLNVRYNNSFSISDMARWLPQAISFSNFLTSHEIKNLIT